MLNVNKHQAFLYNNVSLLSSDLCLQLLSQTLQDVWSQGSRLNMTPDQANKRALADYIYTEACMMPASRWYRFNMDIIQLLVKYKQEAING